MAQSLLESQRVYENYKHSLVLPVDNEEIKEEEIRQPTAQKEVSVFNISHMNEEEDEEIRRVAMQNRIIKNRNEEVKSQNAVQGQDDDDEEEGQYPGMKQKNLLQKYHDITKKLKNNSVMYDSHT